MKNDNRLQLRYINLDPSKGITDLITKKLEKDLNSDYGILNLICNISKQSAKGGEKYSILLEVHMKLSGFAIRETGNDLYKISEVIGDKLHQKILKLNDKITEIHHLDKSSFILSDQLSPKEINEIDSIKVIEDGGKLPILEHRQYSDNSPIHTEEAIELMELAKKTCFLFRNIESGKYAVLYRLTDGRSGYGMIEPATA